MTLSTHPVRHRSLRRARCHCRRLSLAARLRAAALVGAAFLAAPAAPLAPAVGSTAGAQEPAAGTTGGGGDRRAATADSLIQFALERARAADTAAALRALERATEVAPKYARAYYQRAVMLSRTTTLGPGVRNTLRRREAAQHLDRALELDPENPLYLLELGRIRLKTPFFRIDAERMFNKALRAAAARRDPRALAEVHYELGLIHERRYLSLANRNMTDLSASFDPALARNDWRYVRDFLELRAHPVPDAGELDVRKSEAHYRAALLADPTSEGAAMGLFGLLAELRRYEELLRATDELRASQPKSARRYLARGLALHRLERDADAEPALDSGLALLPPEARRDMTSIVTILDRASAAQYERLAPAQRAGVDSLYWDAADPLLLAPGNEARVEFLSRLVYAELRFSSAEFNHVGWQTDQGMVYARYGEPTRVASFASGSANDNMESTGNLGSITTVWWYKPTNFSFVFSGPPAMATSWFAGDFRSYAESARETAPVRFDDVGERLRVDTIGVQVARFRPDSGGGDGDVDVSVFADVPTGKLLRDVDVVGAPVVTGFLLRGAARQTVADKRDSLTPADAITPRAWRIVLPSGEYNYRVEALQPATAHGARGQGVVAVTPFPTGTLSLSDVLVANSIVQRSPGARPRGRADFDFAPNGSLTFGRRDTLFLYWEEYGLKADPATVAGRSRVELTLRLDEIDRGRQPLAARVLGGVADAVGLSAEGDNRVSLRFDRSVPLDGADRVPSYLAVALGDAPEGVYTLDLKVTDLVSGRTAHSQRVLRVRAQ